MMPREYAEHAEAMRTAEAMTAEERSALVYARRLRDDTRTAWTSALDPEARQQARRVHEQANAACLSAESRVRASQDERRRAVKLEWQDKVNDCQERQMIRTPQPAKIRVFDGR